MMTFNGLSIASVRMTARCLCGTTILINGTLAGCEEALAYFWAEHSGEGHGPATEAQQRAAKRKRAMEHRTHVG